ncbi:uncharacterized protein LOC9649672 [Selaginella moellendorffii]|uniref:uncharacterized protein LOC9649672 n=1 Tax=Selaginella moellendorffii TaxID=88036 RepID=UPI000D1C76EA|nr:uncharacterized protein LOC9649672 [Selaginella moellendorffii]|eukprot:XP_024514993.1 uncharacterized protein LOC9649672 [Selaginella moellendorffii]
MAALILLAPSPLSSRFYSTLQCGHSLTRQRLALAGSHPITARFCVAGAESGMPEQEDQPGAPAGGIDPQQQLPQGSNLWQMDATALRAKVAALGLSAVLAYGLFDGITYTTFFVLAFLGYEKSTGQNPAANLKALLGIVVLMWTGNNVTRPFRVAGAAALAPLLDRALKKMQKLLNLPSKAFAFMLVVAAFASLCFSIVGLLILSRWGK